MGPLVGTVMLIVSGGCGVVAGSKVCTDTDLSTPPIRVSVPLAPLTFMAALTAEGKPVAGADVIFFIYRVDPGRPGQESGFSVGDGTTGPDGVARYIRKNGIDGLVLGGERLTGYQAEFRPTVKIGGVQYCGARARGELTVG